MSRILFLHAQQQRGDIVLLGAVFRQIDQIAQTCVNRLLAQHPIRTGVLPQLLRLHHVPKAIRAEQVAGVHIQIAAEISGCVWSDAPTHRSSTLRRGSSSAASGVSRPACTSRSTTV